MGPLSSKTRFLTKVSAINQAGEGPSITSNPIYGPHTENFNFQDNAIFIIILVLGIVFLLVVLFVSLFQCIRFCKQNKREKKFSCDGLPSRLLENGKCHQKNSFNLKKSNNVKS